MPDMPAAPAAPAAPSAPAPSAPAPVSAPVSAPAPVAAPSQPAAPAGDGAQPVVPAQPAAPAQPVVPAQPGAPAQPAKYDPQTAGAPPSSADYTQDAQGIADFVKDNSAWSLAHPDEAKQIREAKLAAEENGELAGEGTTVEAAIADAVKKADETEQPGEVKPAAEAAAAAATPVRIDEWTTKSPELKAAFEKNPELRGEMMEMARQNEAARPVLDIISTPEEAQFAVDHAQRLVSLQTNIMLAGDDPEQMGSAWGQVEEMFKERDANGAEVKGADGKPVLGSDFKPFVRKAATVAMEDFAQGVQGQITALEARLAGNYATEEARAADAASLENAKYEKAAFDFVMDRLGNPVEATALPALPPNATPEQITFQKQLEQQQKELDAKMGKQTAETRRNASKAVDNEVQKSFESGLNRMIDSHVAEMKERGEYLPEFVLTDKWVNPSTGQPTKVSAFGAKIYLAVTAKINNNPLHAAKLGSLQAMGAAGKEARIAEVTRLQNLYLPAIIKAEVTRIQDGIRASSVQRKDNTGGGIARPEPQSAGTIVPTTMDAAQVRSWAEGEAAKMPEYEGMDQRTREQTIISLAAKKRHGG